ncbi:hypothetical protein SPRG_11082 [Saprolegnia parasitica CBS 223.65]|uniref:E3 ubiquitin-protein ligase listerin n=1 Tax=Saprolegnia parasitica (strain CBS 223.65) TaxID=695850 RepID=A0A067CAS8_SAPPC|nr:hypothetical protein SPRG_11082 [Saprolegnia parasitica CBS 223.65]KDO23636.1 hypothetical protein SPRG_11082 [Saprolegnia parasitica CBS 223.65]|eukprot:XP_012205619.1 hypothetical protein SPRG_11082 [Saprolegnia parasitica CBS 223.65]
MGGKKINKQQDKLAKASASSSARAGQLLSGAASSGFIGFGAFAATAAPAPATLASAEDTASAASTTFSFYDGADGDLALALKMLGKRDALTKTKALLNLKDMIVPSRKPLELRPAIGHYCYLYGKLMTENDRRVRQLSNEVLLSMLEKMKKATVFHNHIALLLPSWYVLAMHDNHVETSRLALRAFQLLFPTLLDQQAVLSTHMELLTTTIRTYLAAKVDDLSDRDMYSADEAEERYERILTSSLLSLGKLVEMMASSVSSHLEPDGHLHHLLTSQALSRQTTASGKSPTFSRACVRLGAYKALTSVLTHTTSIALEAKVILSTFQEKVPGNHDAMWTLVLSFVQKTPSLPWAALQSACVPRLLSLLKHGFYGSGAGSYPNVLPLLASMPLPVAASVYPQLLSALWKGLETPHVVQIEGDVVASFLECLGAMATIFLSSPSSESESFHVAFDPSAYVQTTFAPVLASVLPAVLRSSVSDRAFAAFSKHVFALLPRVASFRDGRRTLLAATTDDTDKDKAQWLHKVVDVQEAFLALFHNTLHDACVETVVTHVASTAFLPERLVGLLAHARATYQKQTDGVLLATYLHPLVRAVYAGILGSIDVAHPLSRQFLLLSQLLDVFGLEHATSDPATQYSSVLAPALPQLQPPTDFFKLFWHYVQALPKQRSAMWQDLTRRMDMMDDPLSAAIAVRSLALKSADASLAEWTIGVAPAASLWGVLWDSAWLDRHVNALLIDGAMRPWTSAETLFLASCWADAGVPVVSKKTLDAAVLFCDKLHASMPENVLSLLESLLPHVERSEKALDLVLHVVRAMDAANPTTAHSAQCLWNERLRPRVRSFWPFAQKTLLQTKWAASLNAGFATEDAAAWAAFASAYLHLDDVCATTKSALLEALDALQTPSYRQLEVFAELCHVDHGALVRGNDCFTNVDALLQLVYLDVGFALTWFTVDSTHVAPREMLESSVSSSWLDAYVLLGPLYEAPVVPLLLKKALALTEEEAAPWLQVVLTTHIDNPALKSSVVLGHGKAPDSTLLRSTLVQLLVDALPSSQVASIVTKDLLEQHPSHASILLRRLGTSTDVLADAMAALDESPIEALSTHGASFVALLSSAPNDVDVDALLAKWTRLLSTNSLRRPLAIDEWIVLCQVATTVLSSRPTAVRLAMQLLQSAFSAKNDMSDVVGLKMHTASDASAKILRLRSQLLQLISAVASTGRDHMDLELARHHRDAVLATSLQAIAGGLGTRARVQTSFVHCNDLGACIDLVHDAIAADTAVANGLLTLGDVIAFVDLPADAVATTILSVFNGRDVLWTALTTSVSHPVLKGAVYALLRLTNLAVLADAEATGVNLEADDEAATEAAITELLITPGLATALQTISNSPGSATESLAQFLLWDLYLRMFPETPSPLLTSALGAYVRPQLSSLLLSCGDHVKSISLSERHLESAFPSLATAQIDFSDRLSPLAAALFYRTVLKLPTMVRLWWNDECSRSARSWVAKFCEENISPLLLQEEIAAIHASSEKDLWDPEEMTVRGSKVSREIITSYIKDECSLEMVIRVPASYPLRSVEVECTKRIGISEERWRRWVLQIIKVTSSQDGSLLDAVLLWKTNVDREFDGVDPCPICYSILNPKTMGLPNLPCKTCNNKYHNSCLYKWFNQSSKNKCPICQQPFC